MHYHGKVWRFTELLRVSLRVRLFSPRVFSLSCRLPSRSDGPPRVFSLSCRLLPGLTDRVGPVRVGPVRIGLVKGITDLTVRDRTGVTGTSATCHTHVRHTRHTRQVMARGTARSGPGGGGRGPSLCVWAPLDGPGAVERQVIGVATAPSVEEVLINQFYLAACH